MDGGAEEEKKKKERERGGNPKILPFFLRCGSASKWGLRVENKVSMVVVVLVVVVVVVVIVVVRW